MFTISSQLYQEIASRLRDAVGRNSYFSGSLEFAFEGTDCKLTASLVIYRKNVGMPDCPNDVIDDVVPVWWEFATMRDGESVLNDFSFRDLKEFLL